MKKISLLRDREPTIILDYPSDFDGLIETPSGSQYYYEKGQYHKEDGPAIIVNVANGQYLAWYLNGLRHRTDGPARVYDSGRVAYYLHGNQYSPKEWFEKLDKEQKALAIWNLEQIIKKETK